MPIQTRWGHLVKTQSGDTEGVFTAKYRELDSDAAADGRVKNRWIEAGLVERIDCDGKVSWKPTLADGTPVGEPLAKRGEAALELCELHYTPPHKDGTPDPEAGAAPVEDDDLDFLDDGEPSVDPALSDGNGFPVGGREDAEPAKKHAPARHWSDMGKAYRAWVEPYTKNQPLDRHPLLDAFEAGWKAREAKGE